MHWHTLQETDDRREGEDTFLPQPMNHTTQHNDY